mgnify:CR=1 FL=1
MKSLSDQISYSLSDGKIIGNHNGAHYYTIGQRKGLAIGGYKNPLFVISTNTETNEIFVGEGKNHPGLNKKALKVKFSELNWVNDDFNFENVDIALFSAGSNIAKKFGPVAGNKGCIVIDNSSCFRMDDEVPLIVPEVNPEAINNYNKKIS